MSTVDSTTPEASDALTSPRSDLDAVHRNNAKVTGRPAGRTLVFAHGFGCDQSMWRFVAPAFEAEYRVVLFDHVGSGNADRRSYSPAKYSSLEGYTDDVLTLLAELDLDDVVFVGHSVSAMIGVLAAGRDPGRFTGLVLVGPSPCYVNQDGYTGGFTRGDIDELIEALDSNYLGWAQTMAPVIMGHPDRPELAGELAESFCRLDPEIARTFARATFLSDNRSDLAAVRAPTCIVQCSEDTIAGPVVGEYVHRHIADSELAMIRTSGHCPHLSAPRETVDAISSFLKTLSVDRLVAAP
jgi:sigma-B regulation protein RsbQ